jgi:hypothetical protein
VNGLIRLVEWLRPLLTPGRLQCYLAALFLPQVVLFLVLETTPGVLDRQARVRGRDFIAFYVYGHIILHEDAHRVYERDYFQQVQETFAPIDFDAGRPAANPLYPPTTGLLFCALALLPYGWSVTVWWLVLAGCFALGFTLLVRSLDPLPQWRATAWLALAAFVPVSSTFWNGQLAGLLFLAAVSGLELHRASHRFLAGLALSLLAFKPQLAAGLGLWLLFRLDLRALAGMVLGFGAQVALAALILGPEFFVLYRESLPQYLDLAQRETITPDHQHSLAGILTNWLGASSANACKLVHLLVTAGCAGLLLQIVRVSKQRENGSSHGTEAGRLEQAAAVIFTVFAAPHLHTYDLVLLLVPIVHLLNWAHQPQPSAELGLAGLLYLAGSMTFVYLVTRFSLVPAVLVLALLVLWLCLRSSSCPIPIGRYITIFRR